MKRCPTCATSFVRGGKFCPEDGSLLVDTVETKINEPANTDDLATIPIGIAEERARAEAGRISGLLAGDEALVGQVLNERYRVEEVVGRGGMGVVYRARHLLLDRTVALKLLRPQYVTDERAVARFLREARAMARIEHPNAVHVYDFGVLPGGAYLVMEYVDGDSLRMLLMRSAPLPLPDAASIAEQVCAAVQAAHDQGVLHRDLKPENIMLRQDEGALVVKVVDFGLAKILTGAADEDGHRSITTTNELFGTPCYMAPEFFEGTDIDARSDVYAIGIVLYEMLAGAPPFRGTMQTVIGAHLFKEAPPVSHVNGDVPPEVDDVLRRTLRKDRAERPASAAELSALLRQACAAISEAPVATAASLEPEALAVVAAAASDTGLSHDSFPTLSPLPQQLRAPAARPAAGSQPADSGEIEPTEQVPLTAIAPSAAMGRRAFALRFGVALGSAAVFALALVSFDLTTSTSTADPAGAAPGIGPAPTAEPAPSAPPDESDTEGRTVEAPATDREPAAERDRGERASDVNPSPAAETTAPKARRGAEKEDEKDAEKKPKPAAQPEKDDKKTRKRAWYDPRRWFGKN